MSVIAFIHGNTDSEKEYSRMLSLELEERLFSVVEYDKDACFDVLVAVYDAPSQQTYSEVISLADGKQVIFCLSSSEFGFFENCFTIERPVDIDHFYDLVKALINEKKETAEETYYSDSISLNIQKKELVFGKKSVKLSKKEFLLASALYEKRGEILSRDELKNVVWNNTTGENTNVVDVYMNYLRKKAESLTDRKTFFTVRGKGYMMK